MPKKTVTDSHEEFVDTLAPPNFLPTGKVKEVKQAIKDLDWLGTINIWLYTRTPEPCMFYQLRSPNAAWMPNKLDVAAAGHYTAGERALDGLREMHEELGIEVPPEKLHYFGRKLHVGIDALGRERRSVIEIYDGLFDGTIEDMKLQEEEVAGIFQVPLKPLMQVFRGELESFEVTGLDAHGNPLTYTITANSFVENFDDYQQRMAAYVALKLGVDETYLYD